MSIIEDLKAAQALIESIDERITERLIELGTTDHDDEDTWQRAMSDSAVVALRAELLCAVELQAEVSRDYFQRVRK